MSIIFGKFLTYFLDKDSNKIYVCFTKTPVSSCFLTKFPFFTLFDYSITSIMDCFITFEKENIFIKISNKY